MLSRLISLLRRIPAVKWAFTRLRPVSHSGNIDVTPGAADVSPAITEDIVADDIAKVASADIIDISTVSARDDVEIAAAASEPVDAAEVISNDSPAELPANVESAVVEEAAVAAVEVEPVDVAEPVTSFDAAFEPKAEAAEEAPVAPADVAIAAADAPVLIVNDDASSCLPADVELAVMDSCGVLAESEVSAEDVAESSIESTPSPSVAQIEPVLAGDSAPVATIEAAHSSTDAPGVTEAAPEQVLAPPNPETRSARKPRSKVTEPADRAALIRQRWAETGIRMWNPRLHGTGEATLNIQGSVGLLPPAPGETMPRYDKLEFKLLGGQIVSEGIIVEAPAQATHRSFTRLAEPGKIERVREPARQRQAALA